MKKKNYSLIRKPNIMIIFFCPRNETRRELERKLHTYERELEDFKNIQSVEVMVKIVSQQVLF